MKTIYISLPISISNCDIEIQRALALLWQKYLVSRGYRVINPFDLYDMTCSFVYPEEPSYEQLMEVDLRYLRDFADEIIFLDGWLNSSGCMRELDAALERGLKAYTDKTFKLQ